LTIQSLNLEDEKVSGELYNSGIQEVTIPLLLVSYYDEDQELVWVDHKFVKDGVRVQRKQPFEYSFVNVEGLDIINSSLKNCFVNGLPNSSIAKKVVPDRDLSHAGELLQPFDGDSFDFVKLELNSYIGNPK